MKTEGQWIVMMGFLVSLGIFFLAIIISQSTLVGQTTAEGVLEFPKNDIQDLRRAVFEVEEFNRTRCASLGPACGTIMANITKEIQQLSLYRRSALVNFTYSDSCSGVPLKRYIYIHYNNGVTAYDEIQTTVYC
jgi:hypothetical protein